MQWFVSSPVIRKIGILGVFAAGLIVGALSSPLLARAQSGSANRAILVYVALHQISPTSIPSGCVDVTVIPMNRAPNEPGVLILCERM